jgi:ATP-binding cassette subfamily B protein
MVVMSGFIMTMIRAGLLVEQGKLTVANYTIVMFLSQRMLWPLTHLGGAIETYEMAMAATSRIMDVLDLQPRITGGSEALELGEVRGSLQFADVSFYYEQERPVLNHVSFVINPGEIVGFVGATGAGKTTIIKLLLRLYDNQSGVIRVDGVDIAELDIANLRALFGLVSQDIFLFHGTIRENIAYARPDADMDAIIEAAQIAEIHDFIAALPDSYDTLVGERGQKLSGGQRQRIALARALLKDPPVLILDEATSSIDNQTEAAIQRSLGQVLQGRKTALVIAHRLSTIRHADHIYVLDKGAIVEHGVHESLIQEDGIYATLWRVQTGELLTPPESLDSRMPGEHRAETPGGENDDTKGDQ